MNRFKPGDKARVIGNRDNYHGFKISEEVEILQYVPTANGWKDHYKCRNAKIAWYVNEPDLEPIEPVQEEESPWISVEDRLPDDHQQILFYTTGYSNNSIQKGVFERVDAFGRDEIFCGEGMFQLGNVSHWMPLPNPPFPG